MLVAGAVDPDQDEADGGKRKFKSCAIAAVVLAIREILGTVGISCFHCDGGGIFLDGAEASVGLTRIAAERRVEGTVMPASTYLWTILDGLVSIHEGERPLSAVGGFCSE